MIDSDEEDVDVIQEIGAHSCRSVVTRKQKNESMIANKHISKISPVAATASTRRQREKRPRSQKEQQLQQMMQSQSQQRHEEANGEIFIESDTDNDEVFSEENSPPFQHLTRRKS